MFSLKDLIKYDDIQKEIFCFKEKYLYLINVIVFLELTGILLNGSQDTIPADKKKRRPIVITKVSGKNAYFIALSTDKNRRRKEKRVFDLSMCKIDDCERSFKFSKKAYVFTLNVKLKNRFQPNMIISFDYIKLLNDIKTENLEKIKAKTSLTELSLGNIFEECGCCNCDYIDKLHLELSK